MELLGLDMVAQQLPAITDAAVLGNINFGVNIKKLVSSSVRSNLFSLCNHRCNCSTCKTTNGSFNWLAGTLCNCFSICILTRRI